MVEFRLRREAAAVLVAAVGITLAVSSQEASADLTISLEGQCPGEMTLSWEGAVPDRFGALVTGRRLGEWTAPGSICAGTVINVWNPVVQLIFRTGGDGNGSMHGRIPDPLCGQYLQMVVVDGNPCQTSNVVQIQ